MAQHEKDPAAQSPGAGEASDAEHRAANAVHPVEAESPSDEAIIAPIGEADAASERAPQETGAPVAAFQLHAAPRGKKNRLRFTLLAATLGLLATAGAIGAYRFRDKHEKLAAFATIVDETFARPEKLLASLRETSVKWLGDAARPTKKTPEPAPPRLAAPERAETGKKSAPEAVAEKPGEPSVKPGGNDERVTWSAPPAPLPAPTPPPRPVASAPASETKTAEAPKSADIDALAKRVDELEQIARSALQAAEQPRPAADAPREGASPQLREIQDNLSGLEGRIDELGDELRALREKLDAPKGETRLPREPVEIPSPVETAKANPAAVVVVAHSLQKALDRGAPFASEYAALAAQGAEPPEALAALAPTADAGAPTARQLRASFHPLGKQLEAITEPKPDAPLGDRLLHGVGKLVKVRPSGEKTSVSIAEIAAKIEGALDHDDVSAALEAFAELPEDAKIAARSWEETARRRLDAEKAAASILSSAIAALGKSKS